MSLFGDNNALERIEDRLAKIETLAASLERENRNLKLEYVELYDKVSHQMSRMAKRYSRDKPEVNDAEVIEPEVGGPDPISAKILERRGFLRNQT